MRRPDGGAACEREVNQHRARSVRDERYAIVVLLLVVLRQRIIIVRSRVGANTRGRAAVGERRWFPNLCGGLGFIEIAEVEHRSR